MRNGLADISYTVHGYTPGRFVTTQVAEFPFLGDNSEPVSVAFQRLYARTPAMAEEHKGVKVIAVFTHGPGIVFNTKRPITKAEDLSGLKFRVGGGMVNEISKALGPFIPLIVANCLLLGRAESFAAKIAKAKFIMLPITSQTRGHGTHSLPVVWGEYLRNFLATLPER